MGSETKIEWADKTWNPWLGCTKVSEGCAHCYAEHSTPVRALRGRAHETWGKGAKRAELSDAYWKQPAKWDRASAKEREQKVLDAVFMPLDVKTETMVATWHRPRVFPSLCDWLDDEIPSEWLAKFMALVRETRNLDWLLLTKRPENFVSQLANAYGWHFDHGDRNVAGWLYDWYHHRIPPANVWVGTSVENQKRADERIPLLTNIPARLRFLSVEPMLGPVDLEYPETMFPNGPAMCCDGRECGCQGRPIDPPMLYMVDWVIYGGESGPGARPCDVGWIRDGVKQCKNYSVPAFVKQLGANVETSGISKPGQHWPVNIRTEDTGKGVFRKFFADKKGGDMNEWPEDLRVRQFPVVK